MIVRLKRRARRYPRLRRIWGWVRWYGRPKRWPQLVEHLQHLGWAVQCPICGWRGGAFYAHPAPHVRPNALCPRCGSKERHRLLYWYLQGQTHVFTRPSRIMEVGPGDCSSHLTAQLPQAAYVGVDLASPLANVRGDVTHLPLADGSFDLVICLHVLEHVPDDRRAMAELRRVLDGGGCLLIQVPVDRQLTLEDATAVDPAMRHRLFGQADHVRAYGRDIADRLTGAGFQVCVEDVASSLPAAVVRRHGLPRGEPLYACRPDREAAVS